MSARSEAARTQLHIWNKLLEERIALQKVVVAVREWEKINETKDGPDKQPADDKTIKSLTKLLSSLVQFRDTYRCNSQFGKSRPIDEDDYPKIDDQFLADQHDICNEARKDVISKWCEKTKIGTIPKKGYVALELPTQQLIDNALNDRERLIKRTQLDRTSHIDDSYHPETFNDDDFYHQLLKEMISKDESRSWVELQRLRYKTKRQADTKATKGRKIKKDLIPKLVNFMAPSRPANVDYTEEYPEKIREELMRSLFGGRVTSTYS